jgi:HlyD family secretion protein
MVALALNNITPNSTLPAATLAGYKTNVVTARTEVDTAITTLTAAESALQSAQGELSLAQAGASSQDIEAQQAVVAEAQAQVTSAQVALDHAALVAPFGGTVTNLTAQVGQVVSPGVPLLTLINNAGLKVVVYVSGSDVAQIKTGQKANVTLDAYGTGTTFPATVAAVDNAETTVNGTPAYGVTLYFTNPDARIKAGMTANADIITAEHDGVLEVPSNLVINNNGNYFVLVQNGKNSEQAPVQIGIVGASTTEITSGLSAGQSIVNF